MQLSGIRELFEAGGIVMWPLLMCSILSVALAAERTIFWLKIYKRQQRLARDILNLYSLNNVVGAIEKLRKNIDLPIARVFLFTLELENPTPDEFRLALETEAKAELPLLRRFNHIFDTIVGLAPLLGLQGTIFGLIRTFASINIGNLAATNKAGLTAGISEDLIATSFGLLVGITTLTFASIFRGLYQSETDRIEEYGGHLELLYRRRVQLTEKDYEITKRA
ncbi:MotA/TolQ/ExbB proton channel [Nostoc sp. NIES-3756]|uniref:MotA/TolQ/ExbB proton channel family protein n=1 Tax=Nostoc sp. NIES-3756 TaxID=1751286 RepID=UPI000721DD13|nr:MotA/TolQ/ExbB proton channel family protein [Nostoc sp. NIES-3756]BAT56183.1 MotA/TolQ/ExbB proton channel [Nostoc sp. NIES-3756]